MALVPSGKTRVMVAQNYGNPLSEGFSKGPSVETEGGGGSLPLTTEKAMDDELDVADQNAPSDGSLLDEPDEIGGNEAPMEPKQKKKTLTNYVYKKLEEYGYPGRRLNEFKSKFVRESVSPEGVKDIQVEIPDKKYPGPDGLADTIENEDLRSIASEVSQMFGLNFNGAERSDGKWTIKFTSETIRNPEEGEMVHDNLDEVYGKPSGNADPTKPSPKVAAPTLSEMIKEAKDVFAKGLLKDRRE